MSSKIEVKTDANGLEMILLTDVSRFGSGGRGIPSQNIFVQVSTGKLFSAPPGLPGFSPLSDVEEEMAAHYFEQVGGPAGVVVAK